MRKIHGAEGKQERAPIEPIARTMDWTALLIEFKTFNRRWHSWPACSFRAFSRRSIVFTNIYFRHVFVAAISPEQCATLFYVLCVDTINDTLGMLRGKRATDLYYFGVPFISESIRRETHVKSIFVYLVSDIAKERYFIITLLKMENNHRRVFQKCRSS